MTEELKDHMSLYFVGGRLTNQPSSALESKYYQDPARHVKFENERRERMEGERLHQLCEDWRDWCITRKYFIAPGNKNILARMQPSKVRPPPDASLSDEMSFFNMAIHALADMPGSEPECFVKYYWHRCKNIKKVAAEMKIHRDTFYERKMRFARKAYSMALSFRRAYQEMNEQQKIALPEVD
jgi:hypothetical protein